MDYIIREIAQSEIVLLEDFLYEAIFIPQGAKAPSKDIVKLPELQIYISGFGSKKDDIALVAEYDNKLIGAVWVRIVNDFGHIDDKTPSLSIAICKPFRGKGIGSELMKQMLKRLKDKGYQQTSLSVQRENYAVKMYKKLGYKVLKENDNDLIMVYTF